MSRVPSVTQRALAAAGVGGALLLNVWSVSQAFGSPTPQAATVRPAEPGGSSGSPTVPAAPATAGSAPAAPGTAASSAASTTPGSATAAASTAASSDMTDVPLLKRGKGSFSVASVGADLAAPSSSRGAVVRYTVEVEDGIEIDRAAFARAVASTLRDPRGWQKFGAVHFVNVSPAQAAAGAPVDVRITLATPETVDAVCAPLDTMGQVSCHNKGRVALNLTRWVQGASSYGRDLAGYRTYLVNHEVGHNLGNGHVSCPGQGRPAPVMMQQTKGLGGCTASPWPAGTP